MGCRRLLFLSEPVFGTLSGFLIDHIIRPGIFPRLFHFAACQFPVVRNWHRRTAEGNYIRPDRNLIQRCPAGAWERLRYSLWRNWLSDNHSCWYAQVWDEYLFLHFRCSYYGTSFLNFRNVLDSPYIICDFSLDIHWKKIYMENSFRLVKMPQ